MREIPNNLPAPVTSFVGREREISELVRLLGDHRSRVRLVTLTGAGGVGKTRLALEFATGLLRTRASPDGVWLLELAPLTDSRRLAQVVASVFGLQEEPGRSYADVLADALRTRHLLLLLDNCEHLVAACAELAQTLLRSCRGLTILATSREPLGIVGETTRRVPSLAQPDPRALPPLRQLRACEAVQLFVERATAANADFGLDEVNASAVAEVCTQLDGIPLALELAAARVQGLSVQQIADRLDDRFRLLGEARRAAPPRQQRLEAAAAWSYELLTLGEQRLFRSFAVFAAGWTLGDAEAVCANGPQRTRLVDLLARLVEKSPWQPVGRPGAEGSGVDRARVAAQRELFLT